MTPAHAARKLLALPLLVCLAACSAVPTEIHLIDRSVDFAALDSFAWAEGQWRGDLPGAPVRDAELLGRARRAVEAELQRFGLRRVAPAEAAVHVALQLSVEERERVTDPYFEIYAVQRYEVGVLTLELLDPASERGIWRASARSQLRNLGRWVGMTDQRYVPEQAERVWLIEDKARALANDLPHTSG